MDRVTKIVYRIVMDYTNYVKLYKDLHASFKLDRDLNFDSLDRVELVYDLEEYFHIELSDRDSFEWYIMRDKLRYICREDLVKMGCPTPARFRGK